MRLLACGGRDYHNRDRVFATLDRINEKRPITAIIEGAATGADALAAEWAMARGVQLCECPAGWKIHGKKAGPVRNEFMASLAPDGAVAFGGGTGTAHMIGILKRRGIAVMEVDRDDTWDTPADTAPSAGRTTTDADAAGGAK